MNNLKIIKTIKRNPQQIVFVGFFIYAFSLGAMFPRLDDIQTSLEIDKAELGLLLLCIPLGLQVTLLFADRLVRAISLKNIVCLGIPSICFTQFAAVAVNQIALFAFFLIICGAFVAVVEVAINLEADRVEYALGSRVAQLADREVSVPPAAKLEAKSNDHALPGSLCDTTRVKTSRTSH